MSDATPNFGVYASLPAAGILFGQSLGLSREELLEATNLREEDLADPDNLVDYDSLIGLWTLFTQRFAGRPLGLEYASLIPASTFGAVGYVMAHCENAEAALQSYLRYYRLLDPYIEIEAERRGDTVRIRIDHEPRCVALKEPMELIVGSTFRLAKELVRVDPRGATVFFRHCRVHDAKHYADFFSVPVVFDADLYGFEMDADLLNLPVPEADPSLGRHLKALLERQLEDRPDVASMEIGDVCRLEIERRLQDTDGLQASVAEALHLSSRTLQRRLEQAGLRFSDLVDEVRERHAKALLKMPQLSVQEVAYLLGYSEPRAFHRSFKRWTGQTAGAWRRGAL